MGGRHFEAVERIRRENIAPTLRAVADHLGLPNLDEAYMVSHLIGSAGKQADSGDLDVIIDSDQFDQSYFRALWDHISASADRKFLDPSGTIISLWPIMGQEGKVQIDFLHGRAEWLRFSHHSPGRDISPYKGLYNQTLIANLFKLRPDFVLYDDTGDKIAMVNYLYDLRLGIHRVWRMRTKQTPGRLSQVDPDFWESHVIMPDGGLPPRFPRRGYIDEPQFVLDFLFGKGTDFSTVDTFEKIWRRVAERAAAGHLPPLDAIRQRFMSTMWKKRPIREELQDPVRREAFITLTGCAAPSGSAVDC